MKFSEGLCIFSKLAVLSSSRAAQHLVSEFTVDRGNTDARDKNKFILKLFNVIRNTFFISIEALYRRVKFDHFGRNRPLNFIMI